MENTQNLERYESTLKGRSPPQKYSIKPSSSNGIATKEKRNLYMLNVLSDKRRHT
jgi:hypothetical protein